MFNRGDAVASSATANRDGPPRELRPVSYRTLAPPPARLSSTADYITWALDNALLMPVAGLAADRCEHCFGSVGEGYSSCRQCQRAEIDDRRRASVVFITAASCVSVSQFVAEMEQHDANQAWLLRLELARLPQRAAREGGELLVEAGHSIGIADAELTGAVHEGFHRNSLPALEPAKIAEVEPA